MSATPPQPPPPPGAPWSKILQYDASKLLPGDLDQWTDVDNGLCAIEHVVLLSDDSPKFGGHGLRLVVALGGHIHDEDDDEDDDDDDDSDAGALYMYDAGAEGAPKLVPLEPTGGPDGGFGAGSVDKLMACPGDGADTDAFVLLHEDAVWRVAVGDDGASAVAQLLLKIEPTAGGKLLEADVSVIAGPAGGAAAGAATEFRGVRVAALSDLNPPAAEGAPKILPPPVGGRALTLSVWAPGTGWKVLCDSVPPSANGLDLNADGAAQPATCAFAVMRNKLGVPEEAERGDYHVVRDDGSGACRAATDGAGRVDGGCTLSPNGKALLYCGNYSETKPITTHPDLWFLPLGRAFDDDSGGGGGGAAPDAARVQLTEGGNTAVECGEFGWAGTDAAHRTAAVWFTSVEGAERVTKVVATGADDNAEGGGGGAGGGTGVGGMLLCQLQPAATTPIVWCRDAAGEKALLCFYGSEDGSRFPCLWDGAAERSVPLPHTRAFDDVAAVETVRWKSPVDGTPLSGLVYALRGCPPDAGLVVHVHGGPAITVIADRAAGANSTRYPYRHLLKAGYRVFCPLYRGTLGFGDAFAGANVNKQGLLDGHGGGDLGDILSGVDHLFATGVCACGDRVGIVGGSYGGYMTMRALAVCSAGYAKAHPIPPGSPSAWPRRFKAGVAQYGFVHNRWMSYEGGDFTWEDEYFGGQANRETWPLSDAAQKSDVFNILEHITSPMLLMHGEDDDICPLSQSLVAFRSLYTRKVPTGLITYPGEGHGFDQPVHRRDRCRRVLAWFLQFMPPRA